MLAFTNTPITLKQFSDNIQWHHDQDKLIKGRYWDEEAGKGCAVGCSIYPFAEDKENLHKEAERLTNVPEPLWWLVDTIYEGLPDEHRNQWPLRWRDAQKEGVDYTRVQYFFLHRVLTNVITVEGDGKIFGDVRAAVADVAGLLKRKANGEDVSDADFEAAARAAAEAARAARAAAEAARAARAAAEAARAAGEAGAASYLKMATILIEEMERANERCARGWHKSTNSSRRG